MKNRIALVTGASTGIGYETAALLVRRGHTVILTSRDEERLAHAAEQLRPHATAPLHAIAQDMAAPDAIDRLQGWCESHELSPDILINNAGLGHFGAFAKSDWEAQSAMLDVNVRALTELSHAFLPAMKARGHGAILHVGSVAGFCPGPLMAVYYASKAYVVSFSVALRNEVEGQGIKVSCLCPGPVKTRFQDQAGLSASKLAQASYMEADVVAREGLRGLARNQAVIIPGRRAKMFAFFARYSPLTMSARIVRGVQDTK